MIGHVVAIEHETVAAFPYAGAPQKVDYAVAVIKPAETLAGPHDAQRFRVGFIRPPAAARGSAPATGLRVGQEACFFLTRHPEADFYTTTDLFNIEKKSPVYLKEVAQVRRCAKLIGDPQAGLKSTDTNDRLLTACLLVIRHGQAKNGQRPGTKAEPIDAEQSRLALHTLAAADWSKPDPQLQVLPGQYFWRLNLTPADGWTPPPHGFRDQKEFEQAAKAWLTKHAGTYPLQRLVPVQTAVR